MNDRTPVAASAPPDAADPTSAAADEEARTGDGESPSAQGFEVAEQDQVRRPGELWRIEGSLYAVRAELDQLESLDDAALQARLVDLERRWRDELVSILPESVTAELHRYFDWLGETPAHASELRIGLAQLSGWLDGLISDLGVSVGGPESA